MADTITIDGVPYLEEVALCDDAVVHRVEGNFGGEWREIKRTKHGWPVAGTLDVRVYMSRPAVSAPGVTVEVRFDDDVTLGEAAR